MTRPNARRANAIAAIAAASLSVACNNNAEQTDDTTADRIVNYTVRGEFTKAPTVMEPDTIYVRHEAIPEYQQTNGELGMDVMTMPFPLPEEGVSLEGIEPGDPVILTFAVTYSPDMTSLRGYVLTEITELPADTELDFTKLAELNGDPDDTPSDNNSDNNDEAPEEDPAGDDQTGP